MARRRQEDMSQALPHCEVCNLPIQGVRVGVRNGWTHTWCAPDAPPSTFEMILRRERVGLALRHILLKLVPVELHGVITQAYHEAKAKDRRG
jgi:hypothetical protein